MSSDKTVCNSETQQQGSFSTAMLTVCGRPNVGKSTLVNRLVGEKVAIVSPKPQTTRNRITAIVSHGDTQFILMDTPGFHRAKNRLDDYMVSVVRESVADVDGVLLIVEPIPSVGPQEEALISRIEEQKLPSMLVINKIDTVEKEKLLEVMAAYADRHTFDAILPVSAKTGEGIEALFCEMERYTAPGPHLFPDDMITDQPERQICAELIREKLLRNLDREVPHGTAVEITKFSERPDGLVDIDATIFCEKESHKGIIIGKKGTMLKKVGAEARQDIEAFLDTRVNLQTWVKVKESWRDSLAQLRNFGYTDV